VTEWNDLKEATLARLWGEDLPKREIAERMGISGNAVIGKAHRMGLPPRPSPIKQRPEGAPPPPPKVPRFRLPAAAPPLPSESAPKPPQEATIAEIAEAHDAQDDAPPPRLVRPALPSHRACQWPLGDPRNRADFHFCGAAVTPGKPYCAAHARDAYGRQPRD
jgi:GcrA cell cycle regulator